MGGENSVVDAAAMGGRRDHTGERLIGYRAEVGHGEPMGVERGVDGIEGDTALGEEVAFLGIDLGRGGGGGGAER